MPDQTPEPLTDDELREIIEHGEILSDRTIGRLVANVESARDWARWFAAERDQLRTDHAEAMASVKGWQTPYRNRIDELGAAYSEAQLQTEAADARIAELSGGQGELIRKLSAATARITELEARNVSLEGAFQAAADQAAELATDWHPPEVCPGSEVVQANPHAYIAVKRTHSPNADRPEWDWHATVIPAGDEFAEDRDWRLDRGFDLVPIVGTETGTRPATPQSDPAGYVVVTRNSEGGVHRSATVWDSLEQARAAEGVQAGYADGTGCTAAVYALQEVQQ